MSGTNISFPDPVEFEKLSIIIKDLDVVADKTWAMATSPDDCLLLNVNDLGALLSSDGVVAPDRFYEVVVFNENWQLTATRNGSQARLELITEPKNEEQVEALEQSYLTWGRVSKVKENGWCQIADARTGEHDIPLRAGKEGDTVVIHAREYMERGEFGNAVITCQRLVGIGIEGTKDQKDE